MAKVKLKPWRPPKYTEEEFIEKLNEVMVDEEYLNSLVVLKEVSVRKFKIAHVTFMNYIKKYNLDDTYLALKEMVEINISSGATKGAYNHNMVKHNLNNNFGWKDKTETINHNTNENIETNKMSDEELEEVANGKIGYNQKTGTRGTSKKKSP